MKTFQRLVIKKKLSRIKRKHKNDEKSKKWYWKINLIEEGKRIGINEIIKCNEIIKSNSKSQE